METAPVARYGQGWHPDEMTTTGPRQNPALLRRLLRAKDRIDAASHQAWTIDRLAAVSGVSPAHFARSFKAAFGAPPHRYLLSRRIEKATALLRDTDEAIIDIAFRTGWDSLGTFGRVFRDVTGESPTDLRSRERGDAALARGCAALLRERCAAAGPHNRSFGEAPARRRQ